MEIEVLAEVLEQDHFSIIHSSFLSSAYISLIAPHTVCSCSHVPHLLPFNNKVLLSKSVPKLYESLVLKVEFTNCCTLRVLGLYRPPSASKDALVSLSESLSKANYNGLVFMGDLNWDWLAPVSDPFKCC